MMQKEKKKENEGMDASVEDKSSGHARKKRDGMGWGVR